jgi:hypothetical protein
LGVKRPEREVDRSHPSSAEFKNEWSYDSAPLLRLRGRDREGGGEIYFLRRVRIIATRRITFIMSVRLSIPTTAIPNGRILLKFDIEDFYENLSKTPNLVIIGQKYRALYIKTQVLFIVPTNIKLPQKSAVFE